jgi:hypothetical protein
MNWGYQELAKNWWVTKTYNVHSLMNDLFVIFENKQNIPGAFAGRSRDASAASLIRSCEATSMLLSRMAFRFACRHPASR